MCTNQTTPQTYKPKPIDIYLTDPLQARSNDQDQDQANADTKKWANFFHALTTDERWSAATGYQYSTNILELRPDLSLVPTSNNNNNQYYTTWPEAREKTKLARSILLSLNFVEIPSVWSPRVQMKWVGFPDREFVKKQMGMRGLERFEKRYGGKHGMGNGKGGNGNRGTGGVPNKEWIEFVKAYGPVGVRRERGEGWVASVL